MPTVLITGAGRGIGLEFARRYAADGWRVVACTRSPEAASAFRGLAGDIRPAVLDVTSDASAEALAASLRGEPVDVLVNNAGLARRGPRRGSSGHADVDTAEFADILAVNAIGPFRVTRALLPNLALGSRKLVATVSSRMGSIALNSGGSYAYRASKAAANMVNSCFALELGPQGYVFVVLHPGWVRTDMGGSGADISVEESVAGMRRVLDGVGPADNGAFVNYDGQRFPW
jgi:NAD(P)-dependent dehydrogenase (short-subunit alcohol dehydrogenase family)